MSEESQFNVHGYNIVTILKRLEAATSRLEDITIFQQEANNTNKQVGNSAQRDSNTTSITDSSSKKISSSSGESNDEKPKSLLAFESLINTYVKEFVELSMAIDPIVGQSADQFADAFEEERKFLELVGKAKRPDPSDPALRDAVAPLSQSIAKISEIKEANIKSPFYNNLSALSDGSAVLGWVSTNTPVSLIPEYKDSSQFWTNRILKEFKGDSTQTNWVKEFLSLFDHLRNYAKEYHATGPSWNNATGSSLKEVLAIPTKKIGAGSGPPPPPVPPPADLFDEGSTTSKGGMNAVFADLNKGENITSGLKKVDKHQKKSAPVVPKKPANKRNTPLSTSSFSISKKPPRKELVDGTKWMIDNFSASDLPHGEPIVIEADMHQSVYIGKTDGITVQIQGKANAVSIADVSNTGILVDSLISGVDIVRAHKFGLQITGSVGVVAIDKSDEGSIYLSKESVDQVQIFTSSVTALNINVPKDDDFTEVPAPEQIKHTLVNGKLKSEIFEHAG